MQLLDDVVVFVCVGVVCVVCVLWCVCVLDGCVLYVCVCVLCLCELLQLAYPGGGHGRPLGASQPRVTLGPASLQFMGQLYSTTSVEYPCQHSLQVLRNSYGRALGAGEDPRIFYRPAPGFVPSLPGAFATVTAHMAGHTYLTTIYLEQPLWPLGEELGSTQPFVTPSGA